ncbi:TRAP transporter large permease [Roseomonas genomospecies 6]|uniref:TRAP transporter large permease protein n=1 Tax=Roseomonas genomospecies 6 TaxID=214106 RepID=A0A9W7KNK6_9PROT|nr:TRAP transporter large permease [Roseomonas genomospecies 6]KAA0676238.1 TRAP transporter large permease [Roseomonas genomospecies 6]
MIGLWEAAFGFAVMLGLMFLGFHVAVVMFAVGLLGAALTIGSPIVLAAGTQLWSASDNFVLLAVPLFVLLGEILVRGGSTDRMYRALAHWLSPLPGGLLHTNIGASALFAAVSGSSVATAATIGTVALPAFRNRGYDPRLVLGTVAAGATLGILIPPSINMIIYGAMTNTSVGRLYSAGIVPGLLLTALFMLVIVMVSWWRPSMAGAREPMAPLGVRLRALWGLVPPLGIFAVVMGTIYAGWATPTESAAVAVVVALLMTAAGRRLSISMLHDCFVATVQVTAMITLIVVAAFYLNFVIGILGIPQALARFVAEIGAGPIETMLVLFVFYLILGCFLETLSMMIGTIPVVFPLVLTLGIDPVWFGIFLVVMCELALITPPVGMNLYVVQGVRREGSVVQVIQGTMPFLAMMVLLTFVLIYWQDVALWLPRITFG